MNNKIEKYNHSYQKALATAIQKELPNVAPLVVGDVLIDPSLKHGKVFLKTTPEILEMVIKKRSTIQRSLSRFVTTRYTPSFEYIIDDNYIESIDNLYDKIDALPPNEN